MNSAGAGRARVGYGRRIHARKFSVSADAGERGGAVLLPASMFRLPESLRHRAADPRAAGLTRAGAPSHTRRARNGSVRHDRE